MGKIHESQSTAKFYNEEDDKLYTPIENLQRIEGGGVYKRNNLNLNSLPKGIRIIGYSIIGFTIITGMIGLILSLFNS